MSRPLEDILFAAPSPRARITTRMASVMAAAMLLVLAWSSVSFNLPAVYKPVMQALFANIERWRRGEPLRNEVALPQG